MSFSSQFPNSKTYFELTLPFLKNYHWIYSTKNIQIFSDNVLSNFPDEWVEYFTKITFNSFRQLLQGEIKDVVPTSLKNFFDLLQRLKPLTPPPLQPKISDFKYVGISEKKMHEIFLLAPVVNEICEENDCDLVVDVGSGLGYLSHLLYQDYGLQVLGLEASSKFIEEAYKYQDKFYSACKNNVSFIQLFVGEGDADVIEDLIETKFGSNRKICLAGLHACADLTVTALKLFSKMKSARALTIMPCCYHRISVREEQGTVTKFKNFPCSNALRGVFEEMDAGGFLRVPFLRLACQETLESYLTLTEGDVERRSYELMFRATLELVAATVNCSPRRLKRKSRKSTSVEFDEGFEAYLNNLPRSHELIATPSAALRPIDDSFLDAMREKWREMKTGHRRRMVEVLTGLQAALQAVCENVVLLDRIEFIREEGFQCIGKKITHSRISPRSWALIANKQAVNFQ